MDAVTGLGSVVVLPIAVGVAGLGMVIAMLTAGDVGTIVGVLLAAVMAVLTFRSNAAAVAAREAIAVAREDRAVAMQAAKEAADIAREDRATAAVIAEKAAAAAAAHAIALEKIRTSVDGVASRKDDEVSALKEIITSLRAQLAKEESRASTLAATHAAGEVARAGAPAVAVSSTGENSLKQIDRNTAETESNTARTEAVVQDLKDAK